jgi:hypothetical protein
MAKAVGLTAGLIGILTSSTNASSSDICEFSLEVLADKVSGTFSDKENETLSLE